MTQRAYLLQMSSLRIWHSFGLLVLLHQPVGRVGGKLVILTLQLLRMNR